jgi:hypothetical protein
MRSRNHIRSPIHIYLLFMLMAMTLLLVSGRLIALSAPPAFTAKSPTGGAPLRLRLKVEQTTLRSGQATKIWAEFLDGDYRQVPNDGTRVVKFGIVPPRGSSGSIAPAEVTVKPGDWSAYSEFASGQPSRVLIRASSEGLDADETFLLVTRQSASFLTQVLEIFETVAYATGEFKFPRSKVTVSAGSRAKFQVDSGSIPADTRIRIFTEPSATIIYDGKDHVDGEMEIIGGGMSKDIFVTSQDPGKVEVFAEAEHSGPRASAIAEFTYPKPKFIRFVDESKDITSEQTDFWLTIQLADDGDHFIKSDRKIKISLRKGNKDDPVTFEPDYLELQPGQGPTSTMVRLNQPSPRKELKFLATSLEDHGLIPGSTSVFIRSPIEKLTVTGPPEVKRGSANAEFTIGLLDKDGNPSLADKDRKINLSITDGRLSKTEVTILKNQDSAKVQYFPSLASGHIVLKAESVGLREATTGIVLITPLSWLVLAALGGGLLGGFARHLPKGDKLEKILPTAKLSWNSLAGSFGGSLISGFIFYVALKLGFSQAMGFVLPASLDVGTELAAFFLACIGGYMGVGTVFDGIASLWQRLSQKKDSPAPPAVPRVSQSSQA